MLIAVVPAPAQGIPTSNITVPSVAVSGEASVRVEPDLAILHAGVTNVAKTAAKASEENAKNVAALLAALKQVGIPDRDIQTSRYSLFPQQDRKGNNAPRIVGFKASNSLSIRVTDLAKLSAVLDAVVGAGANDIGGISFLVSQQSTALDQARAEAFADARRKAEIYARAAGVELGRALAITEDGARQVPVMLRAVPAASAAAPVAIGEQTLRIGVSVVFELVQ